MTQPLHPICRRYPSLRRMREKINRYFADCAERGQPCTPSGLALALDMRTFELNAADMPLSYRRLLDRALQRIEADTVELALTSKAASKGVDVVLQHTEPPCETRPLSELSDDELNERLGRLIGRVRAVKTPAPD